MKQLLKLLKAFHKCRKQNWTKEEVVGRILKFMEFEVEDKDNA